MDIASDVVAASRIARDVTDAVLAHIGVRRGVSRDARSPRQATSGERRRKTPVGLGSSSRSNPDFMTLAKTFGVRGARATTAEELEAQLREALAVEAPTLIDVPCGPMPYPY